MTKDAIRFKELAEARRHNEQMEQLTKRGDTIKGITSVVGSALSAASRPISAIIGAKKGLDHLKDATTVAGKVLTSDELSKFESLKSRKDGGERLPDEEYKEFMKLLLKVKKGNK